jgi:hypothetical protein
VDGLTDVGGRIFDGFASYAGAASHFPLLAISRSATVETIIRVTKRMTRMSDSTFVPPMSFNSHYSSRVLQWQSYMPLSQ